MSMGRLAELKPTKEDRESFIGRINSQHRLVLGRINLQVTKPFCDIGYQGGGSK